MSDTTRRALRADASEPDYTPAVPGKVRDIAYISGLAVAAVAQVAVVTVSELLPQYGAPALAIGNAVLASVGIIVSGLGVAYRPGKLGLK